MTASESRQVVLVSGGSRGLGLGIVRRALADGLAVATFSRSASPAIEDLRANDPEGKQFWWEAVDGGDPAALKKFALATAKRFGSVDVLVNNAGVGLDGLLALMRTDDIQRALSVNLSAAIYLIQTCSKLMLSQGQGNIISISSVNAVRGHKGVAVYSATKAALDGLTRSLAKELGPSGIRVNTVAPGYFESDMVGELTEEQKARIKRRTPLGRLAAIDDIVDVVAFMMSRQSRFITGQTIVVDGGITC
ncbi:MAG: SDR family NAD(P)-dependent oxidoreductase [Pirellulales bacterium]